MNPPAAEFWPRAESLRAAAHRDIRRRSTIHDASAPAVAPRDLLPLAMLRVRQSPDDAKDQDVRPGREVMLPGCNRAPSPLRRDRATEPQHTMIRDRAARDESAVRSHQQ